MNIFFIRKLGALGASIATVVAEFIVTAVQLYFIRNDIKIKNILYNAKNYFFASIIMFIVCFIINKNVNDALFSLILQLSIGGLIYGICLIVLKDEFVFDIYNKFKNRIVK